MSDFVSVAKTGTIPANTGITVVVRDRLVAVFYVDGEYRAMDDLCPHMGASLGAGEVFDGAVHCPWHAWRFDTCRGTWCDNPKLKVDVFETRIVGDDVQVCVTPKTVA